MIAIQEVCKGRVKQKGWQYLRGHSVRDVVDTKIHKFSKKSFFRLVAYETGAAINNSSGKATIITDEQGSRLKPFAVYNRIGFHAGFAGSVFVLIEIDRSRDKYKIDVNKIHIGRTSGVIGTSLIGQTTLVVVSIDGLSSLLDTKLKIFKNAIVAAANKTHIFKCTKALYIK